MFLSLWYTECRVHCGISSSDWERMNLHASSCTLSHLTTFHSAHQFMYSQSLDDIPHCTPVYVLSITWRYSTVHSTFGTSYRWWRWRRWWSAWRQASLARSSTLLSNYPPVHPTPHQTTISIPLCLDDIPHCTLVYILSIAGRYPPLHASLYTLNHWTIFNSAR